MHTEPEEKDPRVAELRMLRQRVRELEEQVGGAQRPEEVLWQEAIEPAALLNALPAMVFFKSRDHRYMVVNQRYADHHRLPVDAIVGKSDFEIFVPETAQTYHTNDEAIMAAGVAVWNVELHWKLADGSEGWTMENDVPYCDESGRVIGMVGVVTDVTARKQTEEALRHTEAD